MVPQGPHSHILMTRGSDRGSYFIPKKFPISAFVYPKKIPTFFSIPQKIPQCFCISKFYYLSSGKLKHANFNFGFGQKQNYKLRLCYFWFELMKNTIPKKIPFGENVRPKKILRTPGPVIKICEWGPWGWFIQWTLSRWKYTRDYITGIWFWKAEESLNYKMKRKNIKAADVMRRESSAVVGSKE